MSQVNGNNDGFQTTDVHTFRLVLVIDTETKSPSYTLDDIGQAEETFDQNGKTLQQSLTNQEAQARGPSTPLTDTQDTFDSIKIRISKLSP